MPSEVNHSAEITANQLIINELSEFQDRVRKALQTEAVEKKQLHRTITDKLRPLLGKISPEEFVRIQTEFYLCRILARHSPPGRNAFFADPIADSPAGRKEEKLGDEIPEKIRAAGGLTPGLILDFFDYDLPEKTHLLLLKTLDLFAEKQEFEKIFCAGADFLCELQNRYADADIFCAEQRPGVLLYTDQKTKKNTIKPKTVRADALKLYNWKNTEEQIEMFSPFFENAGYAAEASDEKYDFFAANLWNDRRKFRLSDYPELKESLGTIKGNCPSVLAYLVLAAKQLKTGASACILAPADFLKPAFSGHFKRLAGRYFKHTFLIDGGMNSGEKNGHCILWFKDKKESKTAGKINYLSPEITEESFADYLEQTSVKNLFFSDILPEKAQDRRSVPRNNYDKLPALTGEDERSIFKSFFKAADLPFSFGNKENSGQKYSVFPMQNAFAEGKETGEGPFLIYRPASGKKPPYFWASDRQPVQGFWGKNTHFIPLVGADGELNLKPTGLDFLQSRYPAAKYKIAPEVGAAAEKLLVFASDLPALRSRAQEIKDLLPENIQISEAENAGNFTNKMRLFGQKLQLLLRDATDRRRFYERIFEQLQTLQRLFEAEKQKGERRSRPDLWLTPENVFYWTFGILRNPKTAEIYGENFLHRPIRLPLPVDFPAFCDQSAELFELVCGRKTVAGTLEKYSGKEKFSAQTNLKYSAEKQLLAADRQSIFKLPESADRPDFAGASVWEKWLNIQRKNLKFNKLSAAEQAEASERLQAFYFRCLAIRTAEDGLSGFDLQSF